jgi:hypothetical protein
MPAHYGGRWLIAASESHDGQLHLCPAKQKFAAVLVKGCGEKFGGRASGALGTGQNNG